MLTTEKVKQILRDEYPYLAAEYGVSKIGLFGSYAKGTPTEDSDIDVVVEFEYSIGFRFIEFAEYLESVLGRPVDVLTPDGIRGIRIERVAQAILENTVYVS